MGHYHHVLKNQYQNDIDFLNNTLGTILEEKTQQWLRVHTEYTSTLFSVYHRTPGLVKFKLFDYESLNNLEIIRNLRKSGFEIHHVNVFLQKPNKLAELHIDDGANPRFCSVNLPLRGCEGSEIIWINPNQFAPSEPKTNIFDSKIGNATLRTIGSQPLDTSVVRDDATWEVVEKADANKSIILRTNSWHAVDNRKNSNLRWLFGIRLVDNPKYEDVLEKLSQF